MAQTTGILNGTDLLLYVGGVAIAGATSHTLTLGAETRDTTNKDTADWRTVLPGRKTWGCSGNGLFSFNATYGYKELQALLIAGTVVTIKLSTNDTGNAHWSGTAILTKLDQESPDGQNTTFSYEFVGTAALTPSTTT